MAGQASSTITTPPNPPKYKCIGKSMSTTCARTLFSFWRRASLHVYGKALGFELKALRPSARTGGSAASCGPSCLYSTEVGKSHSRSHDAMAHRYNRASTEGRCAFKQNPHAWPFSKCERRPENTSHRLSTRYAASAYHRGIHPGKTAFPTGSQQTVTDAHSGIANNRKSATQLPKSHKIPG